MNIRNDVLTIIVVGVMLFCASAASAAQLGSWAIQTPLAKLTEADVDLLKAAAREALNNKAKDQETLWSNPDTGHSGSVTVKKTVKRKGQICRKATVFIDAVSIQGTSEYWLCAQQDGTWKIAS